MAKKIHRFDGIKLLSMAIIIIVGRTVLDVL